MTGQDIINKVKELNWPKDSYIVFGSCPMALVGLRESQDIDFLVNKELFAELGQAGWEVVEKSANDKPLTKGDYEVHANWDFTDYKPTLSHLLKTAAIVDGVPFASIQEVRKWKVSSGRPKDLVDIRLIDEYLSKTKNA